MSEDLTGKKLSKVCYKMFISLHDKYNFVYKLHPNEWKTWKSEYPYLVNSGVQVIDNNEKDLYYYFSISDIQIGVYSTALFEGYGFNLITILYYIEGYTDKHMYPLFNKNNVFLAYSEDDLFNIVTKIKTTNIFNEIEDFWDNKTDTELIKLIQDLQK